MSSPQSGTVEFAGRTEEVVWHSFQEWLLGRLVGGVTHLAIEDYFIPTDPGRAKIYVPITAGLHTVARMMCWKRRVPLNIVNPSSWRIHFIGRDKAPKDVKGEKARRDWIKAQTMQECDARRWDYRDDNEAEALGGLDYEWSRLVPEHGAQSTPLFRNV